MLKKKTLVELVTLLGELVKYYRALHLQSLQSIVDVELVLRVICRACSESGYCYLNYYVCFLLAYLNTGYFLTMKFKYDVKLKYEESEPNSWDPFIRT